eukprot:1179577-Prorocentrum_minimum.AAC.1
MGIALDPESEEFKQEQLRLRAGACPLARTQAVAEGCCWLACCSPGRHGRPASRRCVLFCSSCAGAALPNIWVHRCLVFLGVRQSIFVDDDQINRIETPCSQPVVLFLLRNPSFVRGVPTNAIRKNVPVYPLDRADLVRLLGCRKITWPKSAIHRSLCFTYPQRAPSMMPRFRASMLQRFLLWLTCGLYVLFARLQPGTIPSHHRIQKGEFKEFVEKAVQLNVNLKSTAH